MKEMKEMKDVVVTINGEQYPCRPTMGAMIRFKKETGKEVVELTTNDLTELCIYIYCCVVSACAADKVDFNMSLTEFADSLSADDMQKWTAQIEPNA